MASLVSFCLTASVLALAALSPRASATRGDVELRVHVLDMDGIEWRGDLVDGLHAVQHKTGTSVWTADAQTVKRLIAASVRCERAHPSNGTAGTTRQHPYVSHLERVADAPPKRATWIKFNPTAGTIDEGVKFALKSRGGEQGVLAEIAIDNTEFVSLTTVNYTEALGSPLRGSGTLLAPGGESITAQLQVPEVIHDSANGSWWIPAGNALVVGLGVHTRWDARERRMLRSERVIVLDAGDLPAAVFTTPPRALRQAFSHRWDTLLSAGSVATLLILSFAAGWSFHNVSRRSRAERAAEVLTG